MWKLYNRPAREPRVKKEDVLTIRDQIAIAVLMGTQANQCTIRWNEEKFAKYAYEMADVMLEQRKIKKNKS